MSTSIELLTLTQAMQRTGLPRSSLYTAIGRGTFPAGLRIGESGPWRWRSDQVAQWIKLNAPQKLGVKPLNN